MKEYKNGWTISIKNFNKLLVSTVISIWPLILNNFTKDSKEIVEY